MIRVALDTNILAYLAGVDRGGADAGKIDRAREVTTRLGGKARLIAPTQALGELFTVLLRTGLARDEARALVIRFGETFEAADSERGTMMAAMDMAVTAKVQLWDALIVNAAAEAGCALLLSEDMHDGLTWRSLTIVNPLVDPAHEKLASILAPGSA
jgi:predicted nucleic acid-binding protein